jgi:hypothetical protein
MSLLGILHYRNLQSVIVFVHTTLWGQSGSITMRATLHYSLQLCSTVDRRVHEYSCCIVSDASSSSSSMLLLSRACNPNHDSQRVDKETRKDFVTKLFIPALFKDSVHKWKKLQRKGITHRAGQSRVLAQHWSIEANVESNLLSISPSFLSQMTTTDELATKFP